MKRGATIMIAPHFNLLDLLPLILQPLTKSSAADMQDVTGNIGGIVRCKK